MSPGARRIQAVDPRPKAEDQICAHTGAAVERQRTRHDCMVCALAMLIGRPYAQVLAAAEAIQTGFDAHSQPLAPAAMRRIAHAAGAVLVSSIVMDWRYPGIVGVVSKTLPGCGHALFWDGAALIDPGGSELYDLEYVEREAIEFTQRAGHVGALVEMDRGQT